MLFVFLSFIINHKYCLINNHKLLTKYLNSAGVIFGKLDFS